MPSTTGRSETVAGARLLQLGAELCEVIQKGPVRALLAAGREPKWKRVLVALGGPYTSSITSPLEEAHFNLGKVMLKPTQGGNIGNRVRQGPILELAGMELSRNNNAVRG